MNTITMKVLQEALAALTAARPVVLKSDADFSVYRQVMNAEINLRVRLEWMEDVKVEA